MVNLAGGDDGLGVGCPHPVDGGADVVVRDIGAVADNHECWLGFVWFKGLAGQRAERTGGRQAPGTRSCLVEYRVGVIQTV